MEINIEEIILASSPNKELSDRLLRLNTASILSVIRKELGYSLAEIASLTATRVGTVRTWESGNFVPREDKRFRIIEIFCAQDLAPPGSVLKKLRDTHHMSWEKDRGWTVRFTLELHKKQVGTRMKIRLRTHNVHEAIQRRDLIISVFQNMGFSIAKRIQKRKGANAVPCVKQGIE